MSCDKISELGQVGRCGDRLMTLKDVCALPAGHAGWHKADNGCEWTGFVGCEHACCVDARDSAIEARVRAQVAAEIAEAILEKCNCSGCLRGAEIAREHGAVPSRDVENQP